MNEGVGLSLLSDMLHHVVQTDRVTSGRPYLTVVLSFARHHAEDFAGILPRRQQLLLRKYSIELPNSQVLHVWLAFSMLPMQKHASRNLFLMTKSNTNSTHDTGGS